MPGVLEQGCTDGGCFLGDMYGHVRTESDIIHAMTSPSDITPKQQISLRLSEATLNGIDARAEWLGISRQQWFDAMTEWVLLNTKTVDAKDQHNSDTHIWVTSSVKGREECKTCGVLRGPMTPAICQG